MNHAQSDQTDGLSRSLHSRTAVAAEYVWMLSW